VREICARITFLVSDGQTRLSLQCASSGALIAEVELSNEDVCAILGRQSYRSCKAQVLDRGRIDIIGSTMKIDKLTFKMPETTYSERKKVAVAISKKECPNGWEADEYFGSQDSFFSKDGEDFASCTIRKYVHE
jgi:hypothetical protein